MILAVPESPLQESVTRIIQTHFEGTFCALNLEDGTNVGEVSVRRESLGELILKSIGVQVQVKCPTRYYVVPNGYLVEGGARESLNVPLKAVKYLRNELVFGDDSLVLDHIEELFHLIDLLYLLDEDVLRYL